MIERIAVHEAGHVLCGRMLCGMKPLQVCVQPRDAQLGGFVIWDKDDSVVLRREIVPQLARMLGGLVAEKWKYGSEALSAGSGKDLQEATSFALSLVKEYGMGRDHLYHKTYAHAEGPDGFRSATADVDAQVRQWMEEAERLAMATLDAHAEMMERLVAALVAKRSLVLGQLDAVMEVERVMDVIQPSARPAVA
jgi:cell division protease FtsH